MTEDHTNTADTSTPLKRQFTRLAARVPPLWALIVICLTLWGGEYVLRGLWEPDEARYAYVAREMNQGNHWWVPHINGQPYPDKPPLMFWLINLFATLTGGQIGGLATRLPSLLGAVMTLWAITRLMGRWFDAGAAWRTTFILLTSYLFWHQGGWGQIDALLCGLVTMSAYFFFTSLEEKCTRNEFLAYIFAGLALLAKGPVGLLVPMGVFAASAACSGYSRRLSRLHWIWGPLVALALPALWLFMAWNEQPPADYFSAMFGEKSFGRAVSSRGHSRPFYFFMGHFPLEFLPWTLLLPGALAARGQSLRKRGILAWLLFVIVLFSLFVCKRNLYILPAYPAAAMLIGASWPEMCRAGGRLSRWGFWAAVGLLWVLCAATVVALFVPNMPIDSLALLPVTCVLLGGAMQLTRVVRQQGILSNAGLAVLCATFFLLQVCISIFVLPALNDLKAPREAAAAVAERLPPDMPVYLFNQQLAIFPLYANRSGREINSMQVIFDALKSSGKAIAVFSTSDWEIIKTSVHSPYDAHDFAFGHKQMVWVEFSAAAAR